MLLSCVLVGVGGFFGSVLRYLVGLIPIKTESAFPYKTLAINILGAFLLGILSALALKNPAFPEKLALMLKVGVCGGFTTFSTFAFESVSLMENGKNLAAATYIVTSLVFGTLAVFLGQKIVKA